MSEVYIKFIFNGRELTVQCKRDDKLDDIFKKYSNKLGISADKIYFLYGGKKLDDQKKKLKEINSKDKEITIMVYSKDENEIKKTKKQSKYIICPKCKTNCVLSFINYKIELNDCENGHKTPNILFDKFKETQFISESEIKCNKCSNNKSNVFNNLFFRCCNCNINLCPLCKDKHDKDHNVIDYDLVPYQCHCHKDEKYISYCSKCNKNLCMLCEFQHDNTHILIPFKNILFNKNNINLIDFNDKIKKLGDEIRNYIMKFSCILIGLENYSKIITDLVNNADLNKRNYQLLTNLKNVNDSIKTISNDINKIINEKNDYIKIKNIFNIYDNLYNMNQQIQDINNINDTNNNKSIFVKNKEYADGFYTGELIDGVKNGKGTYEYKKENEYKRKFYNGEWKNNMIHGKGKMIWENGQIYEGEWKCNMKEGKGKATFPKNDEFNRLKYEGDFLNGRMNGKGVFEWTNGQKYDGEWKDDCYHGKGTFVYKDGAKYEGEFYYDLKQGKGTYYYSNGNKYIGDFENDEFNGEGTVYYNKNNKNKASFYKGKWKNGEKCGKGVMVWQDGEKYEGNFDDGEMSGKGTFYYKDGRKYVGDFIDGDRTGYGIMYYAQNDEYGRVKYTGHWKDGDRDGLGSIEYKKDEKCIGSFKNDIVESKGIFYYSNGDIYMGDFVNGQRNGKGTYYFKESQTIEIGNYINGDTKGICAQLKSNGEVRTVKY